MDHKAEILHYSKKQSKSDDLESPLPPTVQTGQVQGFSQSTAGGQTVIENNGGLGQASGQTSGPLGNNGGLGQASGPPGAMGADGGLGQTVTGGHGVVGNLAPVAHTGNPSLVPLIAGIGTAAAASGVYAATTSSRPSSSRPSTGTSSQSLGPLVTSANPQGDPGRTKPSHSSAAYAPLAYRHTWTNYNTGDNSGSVASALPLMGASSSMGDAGPSSSQEVPLYNEEGRPLNMPPAKAPLVYLNDVLYQRPPEGNSRSKDE